MCKQIFISALTVNDSQDKEKVRAWEKPENSYTHNLELSHNTWTVEFLIIIFSISGIVLLIGQLADGVSTVFVGYFSDTKDDLWLCNKIGKRK